MNDCAVAVVRGSRRIMERIRLKEIASNVAAFDQKSVTVAGWIKTVRDSKAFGFI